VKRALTGLGRARGYKVRTSVPEADEGGWLFDLTWRKEKRGWLQSIPLALESEWNHRGASYDFQKLIIARADRRVMILSAKPKTPAAPAIQALIQVVERCALTRDGDRYLFACWIEPEKKFEFRLYVAGAI